MKVYSLIGRFDYEGSNLVGVFGSVDEAKACVLAGNGQWCYDSMYYVESELGVSIESFPNGNSVEVEFKRYR